MLLVAVAAGLLIGLALGALGGGGSILAVPVLVYLLGQSPTQATTGSLVVVGLTSVVGAVAARRAGHVRLGRGVAFGLIATGGAVVGAVAAAAVPAEVLMALFALLMLLVGALMVRRLRRHRESGQGPRPGLDDPIVGWSRGGGRLGAFRCDCPRAAKLLVTATVVGLLTGFLGVGGGFVVVPALLLAFDLPMPDAVGTSLVVITVTSAVALAVRAGSGTVPDWTPVLVLTVVAAAGAVLGARVGHRADAARLQAAFAVLTLVVAMYTAVRAVPDLLAAVPTWVA